jgi:O-antigen/teichoic acid export membrane protein
MKHHLLTLGRQTLVYGLSGAALQFVGVFTLPVMAHVFSTAEYGVLELLTVMIAAVGIFVDLGLTSASQRSYYDYSDQQVGERKLVLATTMATSLVASFVVAAVLIAARLPVSELLTGTSRYGALVTIAALTLPASTVTNLSREIMRLRFRAWHYLISSLLAAVAGAAFIVISLTALHMGLEGALLGGIVGTAIAGAYGLVVVRRDLARGYSLGELKTMLDYGLPLVPTAAALWALALVDRLMLSRMSNLSEVGEYAMANRLALVLTMATVAFATAFSPFMLSMYATDPEEEKRVRARTFTYMSIIFASLALLVSLYAREIFQLIAPRFDTAYEAVGLLALGGAVNGIANIALGGISLARQTRRLVIYTGIAAAINIALNFAVIPVWGMVGAAFATAVAYVALLCLYYRRAQRIYPTPYHAGRVLRLAALIAVPLAVGAIPIEPLALALGAKTAALALFVLGLRLFGVLQPEELAWLRDSIRQRAGLSIA